MPRDAPLTSATSLLSITASCGRAERGADRLGIFQGRAADLPARSDTSIETREHFAGAAFEQLIGAATDYFEHRFGPAHGTGQLPAEQLADQDGVTVLAGVDGTYIGIARRLKCHGCKVWPEAFRSRAHQARMRRHADRQKQRPFCAALLGSDYRARHRGRMPGDYDLPRTIEIHGLDDFPLRCLRT